MWASFYSNFPQYLSLLPYHQYIINSILSINLTQSPNLLLYGAKGFPFEMLFEYAFAKQFQSEFPIQKQFPKWNNEIPFIETRFYIELDARHPDFPKNSAVLIDFIVTIISSKCLYLDRHIILLKHFDELTQKSHGSIFKILLERFSQNVLFCCTTHYLQRLEPAILSRMSVFRVPLPTLTETQKILNALDPSFDGIPKTRHFVWNLHFYKSSLDPTFHYPSIQELQKMKLSQTDIRQLSYKLFQHQISVAELIQDTLHLLPNESIQLKWVEATVPIEHQSHSVDLVKHGFYLELILNLFELYKTTS